MGRIVHTKYLLGIFSIRQGERKLHTYIYICYGRSFAYRWNILL